jgi:hypothetical protein
MSTMKQNMVVLLLTLLFATLAISINLQKVYVLAHGSNLATFKRKSIQDLEVNDNEFQSNYFLIHKNPNFSFPLGLVI